MNKYTPGPWKTVQKLNGGPAVEPVNEQAHFVICHMPFSSKTTWANAKLIAAAPELLEALEGIVDWISVHDKAADKYNAAKTAIAKAKGGVTNEY